MSGSNLEGTAVGSNGLLTGSEVDKEALAIAQQKPNALNGAAGLSNGLTSNELDKAIRDATPPTTSESAQSE